ncbi:hypothetical protein IFT85_12205 [Sphingomonas sp. CFBP 8764]|nr:hypothetical protein [Sphingomonas sp. CFBP 8764]
MPVEMRDRTPGAATPTPPGAATPTPPGATCKIEALGDLIGKRASDARADVMLPRSGARTLRWIAPNDAVTMDFRTDRLNVYVDGASRIERFTCA